MTTVIKTTILFRRGKLEEWLSVDPVLAEGEPSYVTDTAQFKIGDGVNVWSALPFQGAGAVYNAATHYDFPSIGSSSVIYKAESEQMVYQWNSTSLVYEPLNSANLEVNDIDVINGGDASGTA